MQLAEDVRIARVYVGVNALMANTISGCFFERSRFLGMKVYARMISGLPAPGALRIRDARGRQAGVLDFVDLRDIAQQHVPHQVVDVLH